MDTIKNQKNNTDNLSNINKISNTSNYNPNKICIFLNDSGLYEMYHHDMCSHNIHPFKPNPIFISP